MSKLVMLLCAALITACQNGVQSAYEEAVTECTADVSSAPGYPGCFKAIGTISKKNLYGISIRMVIANETSFDADLLKEGEIVGNFHGDFLDPDNLFTGHFKTDDIDALIDGVFSADRQLFKSMVYDRSNITEKTGFLFGNGFECTP
jgi:hypothetical protein